MEAPSGPAAAAAAELSAADLALLDTDGARRLGHALVDALADLHVVDPAAVR